MGVTPAFETRPQPAVIQVASGTGEARTSVPCTLQGMNGKRLRLEAGQRLPASTAVSVEYNDALFLGEVIACTSGPGSSWLVEVKIEQILTGLQSLVALRSRLLGEGVPTRIGLMPAEVRR